MTRTEADGVALEVGCNSEDGGDIVGGEAFVGGALVLDATLVEQQQAVAILPSHVKVVDDKEDGLMLLAIDLTQKV